MLQDPECKKAFKSLYALNKHVGKRHQGVVETLNPIFNDGKGNETLLPKPRENLDQVSEEGLPDVAGWPR